MIIPGRRFAAHVPPAIIDGAEVVSMNWLANLCCTGWIQMHLGLGRTIDDEQLIVADYGRL
jgi:hypothetical protein